MENLENIIKKIIKDINVELLEEFKENFIRKGFFQQGEWKHSQRGKQGRTMLNTGNLRDSFTGTIKGTSIHFSSSLPYANIHNEGGEIIVTQRMKNFFWAKHIETKNVNAVEAEFFKAMALKKVGSKIIIPQRQFIGDHPKVHQICEQIAIANLKSYFETLNTI